MPSIVAASASQSESEYYSESGSGSRSGSCSGSDSGTVLAASSHGSNSAAIRDATVRPDYDFLPALRDAGFMQQVVAVNVSVYYMLDPVTNRWLPSVSDNAAGRLRALASTSAVPGLNPAEVRYLKSYAGGNNVVRSLYNEIQDRAFVRRLDPETPVGVVAMADGFYDARAGSFRGFTPEACVSRCTTGYPFPPPEAVDPAHTAFMHDFYSHIFPDAGERRTFLLAMANALFGGGGESGGCLVLVDDDPIRGSSAKTTCMRAVECVFGDLSARTERSFLHVSGRWRDRDLRGYKGKRLAFFDDPDIEALDVGRLNDLTSGWSTQGGRRRMRGSAKHARETAEDDDEEEKEEEEDEVAFRWQALIVLAGNSAAEDSPIGTTYTRVSPFLRRVEVLRMRSTFCFVDDEDDKHSRGQNVYPAKGGGGLRAKLRDCRDAHFHVLAELFALHANSN